MLKDGLYEQIINKGIDKELAGTNKLYQTAPIDSAEAPKILAKYVAEVVEQGLKNLNDNIQVPGMIPRSMQPWSRCCMILHGNGVSR